MNNILSAINLTMKCVMVGVVVVYRLKASLHDALSARCRIRHLKVADLVCLFMH